MLDNLHRDGETDGSPYCFHIYGGHKVSRVATFLRDHLAATSDFVRCTGTPTPPVLSFLPGMHKL